MNLVESGPPKLQMKVVEAGTSYRSVAFKSITNVVLLSRMALVTKPVMMEVLLPSRTTGGSGTSETANTMGRVPVMRPSETVKSM